MLRRYIGEARPHLISAHRGQVDLVLAALSATHRHVVALGPPGGGKTFGAVSAAYMLAMVHANACIGVVAPTDKRLKIVWRDFLRLANSFGTVVDINKKDGFIVLANGCTAQFVSGQTGDKQRGSSAQGWTWSAAVIDEAQSVGDETMQEVEFRGRAVGDRYVVIETCTNSAHPVFRARLEAYKADPETNLIIRYRGEENVFVPLSNWQAIKRSALISERDWRTKFLLEDLAPEHVLYPTFHYAEHIRPLPQWQDITEQTVEGLRMIDRVQVVVGQDFGVLRTVSILLRCFRHPQTGRRTWWAVDELTSNEGISAGYHASQLSRMVEPSTCLVVADPHVNQPNTHGGRADYSEMRAEGFRVIAATSKPPIPINSRISLVRALLKNAKGEIRLYLAADSAGKPRCAKLAQALLAQEVPASGRFSETRKDYSDLSHWPDALGYGLWPFESQEMVYGVAA